MLRILIILETSITLRWAVGQKEQINCLNTTPLK